MLESLRHFYESLSYSETIGLIMDLVFKKLEKMKEDEQKTISEVNNNE